MPFIDNREIELILNTLSSKPSNYIIPWTFAGTIYMKIDELLINLGVSLPFGGSLLVVAQKKKGNING